MARILITGGAGFIGSALVRQYIAETTNVVANVDALTYAGNLESLEGAREHERHHFHHVDICDAGALSAVFETERPDVVIHLAAESHVDTSIERPAAFVHTNLVGTFTLLQVALEYWGQLPIEDRGAFRFVHVSTDEVFGALGTAGSFTEESPYRPSSPYAASKAGADHLARAWGHTYGLPVLVTNCSNNFGPCQYPEKLIPLTIRNAADGLPLPVYNRGENVRDWIFVEDHARALRAVADRGRPGETYAISAACERANLDVVRAICTLMDELKPDTAGPHARLISFVSDRPGHDFRYAIDSSKVRAELGWAPRVDFDAGLRATVGWYLANPGWSAARPLAARA